MIMFVSDDPFTIKLSDGDGFSADVTLVLFPCLVSIDTGPNSLSFHHFVSLPFDLDELCNLKRYP